MSTKLIDLNALSAYKTSSDAKYQDKLMAGAGITISNNVISASGNVTQSEINNLTSGSIVSNTLKKVGEIIFQPGLYFIMYACQFSSNTKGYRQIGFSINTTDPSGYDLAFMDSQAPISGLVTQTMISGVFEVSANDYPNGRTFYFLAKQTSGSSLNAYPRAYYLKF